MMIVDFLGYGVVAINLASMAMKSERNLRLFSIVANIALVGYGAFLSATPLVIGGVLATLIHITRVRELTRGVSSHNSTSR